MTKHHIEVYKHNNGDWGWRKRSVNGQIVGVGEGYETKDGAEEGALAANPDITEVRVLGG